MWFFIAPAAEAYNDDDHHDRDHGHNSSRARRDAQRHAEQHRTDEYYRNRSAYGYGGNDPYYRDPYYDGRTGAYDAYPGRGAYGSAGSGAVVDRVLYNLNTAASNSRVDSHERGHFNTAQQELMNFQSRWAQGQFDTGRLDRAVSAIQDLVNSDQLNPRYRSVLANDLAALRQFRASGGRGGYYAPSYQSGPYGYGVSGQHQH
jgi:hypothetical protein